MLFRSAAGVTLCQSWLSGQPFITWLGPGEVKGTVVMSKTRLCPGLCNSIHLSQNRGSVKREKLGLRAER